MPTRLAYAILQRQTDKQLTFLDLANAIGVQPGVLDLVVSGQSPDTDSIHRYAAFLDISDEEVWVWAGMQDAPAADAPAAATTAAKDEPVTTSEAPALAFPVSPRSLKKHQKRATVVAPAAGAQTASPKRRGRPPGPRRILALAVQAEALAQSKVQTSVKPEAKTNIKPTLAKPVGKPGKPLRKTTALPDLSTADVVALLTDPLARDVAKASPWVRKLISSVLAST